jgi:hypothetical protein
VPRRRMWIGWFSTLRAVMYLPSVGRFFPVAMTAPCVAGGRRPVGDLVRHTCKHGKNVAYCNIDSSVLGSKPRRVTLALAWAGWWLTERKELPWLGGRLTASRARCRVRAWPSNPRSARLSRCTKRRVVLGYLSMRASTLCASLSEGCWWDDTAKSKSLSRASGEGGMSPTRPAKAVSSRKSERRVSAGCRAEGS